jgi:hypothetical protein
MTKTLTESNSYQAAWDERSKKHKRFSRLVYFSFFAVLIAVIAWFGFWLVENFRILGSSTDPEVRHVAGRDGGSLAAGAMLSLVILGMIYEPFNRAVGWSEWILGERPADDFKPREPKNIDVRVEQIDENTRIFHIPGLYRPDGFAFKVTRVARKKRFHKSEYSYQITALSDNNWIHYTLDSSLFTDMSEDEIYQDIVAHISLHLEDKTDYFKELNFTI